MIADGYIVGDGTWELRIYVTDLQVERTLRVKGDLHIGGVMLRLVEDLDVHIDWSDHALWWPKANMWLTRTRSTLDQYGVQADSLLHFTPMHKTLRIQLPDLRFIDARVDYSVPCFNAVQLLCKELGIRHAEEMSFCRPLIPEHLKKNYRQVGVTPRQRQRDAMGPIKANSPHLSHISSPDGKSSPSPYRDDLLRTPTPATNGLHHSNGINGSTPYLNGSSPSPFNANESMTAGYIYGSPDFTLPNLAISPPTPTIDGKSALLHPKSLVERARINSGWLDSSLSLFEQDVREFDLLLLRFKFYTFYDLNPKLDASRINQIYEQAKWQILTENIECTEEEMMLFAALQLQVNLTANSPLPDKYDTSQDDDIDAALNDLQITLEGGGTNIGYHGHRPPSSGDIMHVPELANYLKFMKPKKFTLKSFKRLYFVFRDTTLSAYKSHDDRFGEPAFSINIRGCEVTPDVNLSQRKYGIRLEVPHQEGMTEYWLRCETEDMYSKWMAAFKLASKGRTMADSSYDIEVRQLRDFLSMQHPAPAPAISPHQVDINPDDYLAPRFLRKLKGRQQIVHRVLEAHANVKDLGPMDARLNFIRAWQALPEYGITHFVVKFVGGKKEEIMGVAHNRLMRMDAHSGDHIKTWRFNAMKAWNVNWEVKQMLVQFEDENIQFSVLSADCKVIHEFIGGYIFLSMRSKDSNQTLDEKLFHKLTGGWT